MNKEIEVTENEIVNVAGLNVEEDASMRPLIVSEDDHLKKSDIEVSMWKDANAFLVYLRRALGTVPPVAEGSRNSLKRAVAYYDNLLAEVEGTIIKDAEYVDFNELQVSELDHIDNAIVTARNALVEKLEKVTEGNIDRQQFVKKASTPANVVYTVDPFLKAIAMTCINAKVQGGKNIEEIYKILKAKYEMDEREDLAVLQILRDSGYPIRHSFMEGSDDMIEQYYA